MHLKTSYWDQKPNRFRGFLLIHVALLSALLIFSIYYNATTVFTGTNYCILPSHIYIQNDIPGKKVFSTPGHLNESPDKIPAGSFLLKMNDNEIPSPDILKNLLKHIPSDSEVKFTIVNPQKAFLISDMEPVKIFWKLSDTFLVASSDIPDNFFRFLEKGSLIGALDEGGATERAGIKPGDILLTMNDKEITTFTNGFKQSLSDESLKFLRNHRSGDIIQFKVLRENREILINVQLATFGIQLNYLLILLCGLPIIALGIFFGLKRPLLFAARITSFALIFLGFQITLSYSINAPNMRVISFLSVMISNLLAFLMLPLFFHSFNYFPKERSTLIKNRWNIVIPYIISIFTCIIFLIWYFIDINSMKDFIFISLFLINIIYYIIISSIHSRKETREQRKIARIIQWSFIIPTFCIVGLQFLFNIGLAFLNVILGWVFFTIFLIPLGYLYITWRYRLLDIDFRIKRNIQYNILSIIWKLFLINLFCNALWGLSGFQIQFPNIKISGSTLEMIGSPLNSDANLAYNKILIIVVGILLSILIIRINKSVQSLLDKKYYRQKYDYKKAQTELIKLFSTKRTINTLAHTILEKLSEYVHLKRVGILFFINGTKIWEDKLYRFDREDFDKCNLLITPEIISGIQKFSGTFSVDYLSKEAKAHLKEHKFSYILPIKSAEKYLAAIFIGEKLAENELNEYDNELLTSISLNISVAIENVFLYEELTKQERMKHELDIARRIQIASLPQSVPQMKGLDIAATSIPAMEVGGDFYDFLNGSANNLTVIIGDVSGKGTSAALYMSKVQGIFQTLHEFELSPSQLLIRANRLLYKHIESNSYITAISANFETENHTMKFSRAGHLPLFYFKKSTGMIEKIRPDGIGLGLSEEEVFNNSIEEKIVRYTPGDIFLFFSDGITESRNKNGLQFGEDRLTDILIKNSDSGAQKICDTIINSLDLFSMETDQFDDMTLVVVKSN